MKTELTIEEKARCYAEKAFAAALEKPWPEAKQSFADAYLAGAREALSSQWIRIEDGLPADGQEVVVAKRWRNPKTGVWHENGFISDTYDAETGFVYEDVFAWMPLPAPPSFLKK